MYIPGISELPLAHRLILLLLGESLFFLPSFVLCACMHPERGTAGEPGAIAGVSGHWRVEVGLEGARSPFSWLGVACASRHERSMNGLCLASWCGVGYNMYKSIRVVRDRKIIFKRCLFLRPS